LLRHQWLNSQQLSSILAHAEIDHLTIRLPMGWSEMQARETPNFRPGRIDVPQQNFTNRLRFVPVLTSRGCSPWLFIKAAKTGHPYGL
jgi:hypothetical protein